MKAEILLRQIVPPLLLAPLLFLPVGVASLAFWLVGIPAALLSVVKLLGQLPSETGRPPWRWETMLRPCLTLLLVGLAMIVALLVGARSDRYVADLVSTLQRACKEQPRCPASPAGWTTQGKYAHADYGHWRFTYVTSPAADEYGLWIYKDRDDELCIHGGRTVTPSEVKSIRCRNDPAVPTGGF